MTPVLWEEKASVRQVSGVGVADWWLRDAGSGSSASGTHCLTGESPGECGAPGPSSSESWRPVDTNNRSKFLFYKKP